jgi:hypothetical protein
MPARPAPRRASAEKVTLLMSSAADFARHVPGFDFLQGLLKNAGAGLPHVGQWIAPTLDPEELDKRIQELKTVQFWLEQNAKLLATTIQALEVQRMTLATLKGMNLPMADLTQALKIKPLVPAARPAPEPETETEAELDDEVDEADDEPAPPPPRRKPASRAKATAAAPAAPVVDPMQWWGALTQQFTELAAQALKDGAKDGAKALAGAVVKQSVDSATQALKTAATLPVKMAGQAARSAQSAGQSAGRTAAKKTQVKAGGTARSARAAPRRR